MIMSFFLHNHPPTTTACCYCPSHHSQIFFLKKRLSVVQTHDNQRERDQGCMKEALTSKISICEWCQAAVWGLSFSSLRKMHQCISNTVAALFYVFHVAFTSFNHQNLVGLATKPPLCCKQLKAQLRAILCGLPLRFRTSCHLLDSVHTFSKDLSQLSWSTKCWRCLFNEILVHIHTCLYFLRAHVSKQSVFINLTKVCFNNQN